MNKHLNVYCFLLLVCFNVKLCFTQVSYESFQHDGLNRQYITYLPNAHTSQSQLPVVLILHGYGQTAYEMMIYTQFNQIAENNDFIAIYPQGILNSWNSGLTGNSSADDIGFIDRLIDTLSYKYNVDLSRVYSCGLSNGAFFSYQLACFMSERIAAIASVAGSLTTTHMANCNPSRQVPIFEIHGNADLVVPYLGTTGVISVPDLMSFWAIKNNCSTQPTISQLPDITALDLCYIEEHNYTPCAPDKKVVLYKVINGGHTWPGAIPFPSLGNTNQDIDASQEIWNFFSQFFINNNDTTNTIEPIINNFDFKLFPNPTSDYLHLCFNENIYGEIMIFSQDNKLQFSQPIKDDNITLNISSLSKGIYYIKIPNDRYYLINKSFIVI